MNNKLATWLALAVSLIVVLGSAAGFVWALDTPQTRNVYFYIANAFLNAVYISAYGIVGALILARQPRNTVGWLLLIIGLSLSVGGALLDYLGRVMSPVTAPDWTTYLSVWLNGWLWWLLIGPLMLLLLVFPKGSLLSLRWRWVVALIGVLFISFLVMETIAPTWQDPNSSQRVTNPFGVVLSGFSFNAVLVPWVTALFSTAALCVSSVFIRYRRSSAPEREQLKWFLYASGVFLLVYASGITNAADNSPYAAIFGLLLDGALLFIPVSIGIAILRYHLFDIDVIIRRTLVYAVLTALLALFYFGSVVVLQQVFRGLTGQGSDLAIILSTLAIFILFVPVRNRVQRAIDRRFYRRKYNAGQVLATFATTVRDEVDLERLTGELQSVVEKTMQPEQVSVWLKKPTGVRNAEKGGN